MKTCADCGETKPLDDFHVSGRSRATGEPYRNARCGPCRSAWRKSRPGYADERSKVNARRRQRYASDPEYRAEIKRRNRIFLYGVDQEWVLAKVAEQGGCAVCGTNTPGGWDWHVDHDHACCPTEKTCGNCLRGVLCGNCNLILGHAGDSADRLMAAAAYLLTFQNVLESA
jgi:hypothetical protein